MQRPKNLVSAEWGKRKHNQLTSCLKNTHEKICIEKKSREKRTNDIKKLKQNANNEQNERSRQTVAMKSTAWEKAKHSRRKNEMSLKKYMQLLFVPLSGSWSEKIDDKERREMNWMKKQEKKAKC